MKTSRRVGFVLCLLTAGGVMSVGPSVSAATPVALHSTFATDAEGWHELVGSSTTVDPTYVATGGNPGGFLEVSDADGHQHRFQAPVAWGQDLSGDYGGAISFDMRTDSAAGDLAASRVDVELYLNHGFIAAEVKPITTSWTHYTVPLVGSHFCGAQGCATQADLIALLADSPAIRILPIYQTPASEHTDLDNVSVTGPTPVHRRLTVFYNAKKHRLQGHLTAKAAACVSHQTVQVFKKRLGADAHAGKATTSASGGYVLSRARFHGKYYVTAARHLLAQAGDDCLAATSPTVKVR